MNELTTAQKRALRWLQKRGGTGVIDTYGRMVARGEVGRGIDASTWLRLLAKGCLAGGGGRIWISQPEQTVMVQHMQHRLVERIVVHCTERLTADLRDKIARAANGAIIQIGDER